MSDDKWAVGRLQELSTHTDELVSMLARDLIAAQARIAELEQRAREVQTMHEVARDMRDDTAKRAGAYSLDLRSKLEAQLAAAEAAVARVRELTAKWNKLADEADARQPGDGDCGDAEHGATRDTLHACADELRDALSPPVKGGE